MNKTRKNKTLSKSNTKPLSEWILLANNGEKKISSSLVRKLRGKKILALDGSANLLKKVKITPALLLGDFDSIEKITLDHFKKKKTLIHKRTDQNKTDFEKAILELIKLNVKKATVFMASGGRIDHQWHHYILAKKYLHKLFLQFDSEIETSFLIKNKKLILSGKKGQRCSFLPFSKCLISSTGLKYDMKKQSYSLSTDSSISNQIQRARAYIHVKGHVLCVLEKELPYFIEPLK
ncbi:MAG: thiamine diphosphokinase [Oligoflexia bacterium]|nr:thiamine diphosphokinase [Oligoflexia bacterium]